MHLAKLVNWSKTMEALHEIQHVPGAQAGCITIIEVIIQGFVRQLLILETQRLQRVLQVLDKQIPPASPWT